MPKRHKFQFTCGHSALAFNSQAEGTNLTMIVFWDDGTPIKIAEMLCPNCMKYMKDQLTKCKRRKR